MSAVRSRATRQDEDEEEEGGGKGGRRGKAGRTYSDELVTCRQARARDVDVVDALAVAAREHHWLVIGMREGKSVRAYPVPSGLVLAVTPNSGMSAGSTSWQIRGSEQTEAVMAALARRVVENFMMLIVDVLRSVGKGGPIELLSRERRAQASSLDEQGKAKAKA